MSRRSILSIGATEPVDVEDPGLQHLLAAEGQELASGRLPVDWRAGSDSTRRLDRIVHRHVVEHQIAVAENRREEVVEIVGDVPARRLTASIFCDCRSCSSRRLMRRVAGVDDDGAPTAGSCSRFTITPFLRAPRAFGVRTRTLGDDLLARGRGLPSARPARWSLPVRRVNEDEVRPARRSVSDRPSCLWGDRWTCVANRPAASTRREPSELFSRSARRRSNSAITDPNKCRVSSSDDRGLAVALSRA